MVDMEEMMNKVNNINDKVEELYSKEFHKCEPVGTLEGEEAVTSICGLKSCIAQQAKEITELTRQVDNQRDTIKNMGDNIIAIAKERDNFAASLEKEKEYARTCNNNFYDYRMSTEGVIKGYQQELEKVRSERDAAKATNDKLKVDKNYYKSRYGEKVIEFNRLNGEYHDLENEHYALTEAAYKYSWKRVDCLTAATLEDHGVYLFAVDGYHTPVKGKFHADGLSNITIIVDDGKGKGPEQKTLFFMDGHIRYWTPLPEMPDMPEGVDLDD